jgi:hypothetical protein
MSDQPDGGLDKGITRANSAIEIGRLLAMLVMVVLPKTDQSEGRKRNKLKALKKLCRIAVMRHNASQQAASSLYK